MKTEETILKTTAIYSDDGDKRYLLSKVWDEKKPKLAIIMLVPSTAGVIELDSTTQLVLNNANRLGYGKVDILNLFSTLNDYDLKLSDEEDVENIKAIVESAKEADTVVYAAGVGKATNELFLDRQAEVLDALRPFEDKLYCIGNEDGTVIGRHPLSPAVRRWKLYKVKCGDKTETEKNSAAEAKTQQKKKKEQ